MAKQSAIGVDADLVHIVDRWVSPLELPTRASTSTFTVTNNATNQAIYVKGRPLKYTSSVGGAGYGIVTNYNAGTVTIAGLTVGASGSISAMAYGDMARVVQVPIFIPGYFEDAANSTLIASDLGQELVWGQGAAYCVRVRARNRIADTGASDAVVNAIINGSAVLSTGLTLAANTTWYSSVVEVASAAYDVQFDEVIEVSTTKGTNGNAQDLSMHMTFVVA